MTLQLYAASCMAIKGQAITHSPLMIFSTSEAEALGMVLLATKEHYPLSDDWCNHSVAVMKVPEQMLESAESGND